MILEIKKIIVRFSPHGGGTSRFGFRKRINLDSHKIVKRQTYERG